MEEFDAEVDGWLLQLGEVSSLAGEVRADVVSRKSATAGCLDGWGWREMKILPVPWFDWLSRICGASGGLVQIMGSRVVYSAAGGRSSVEAWYTTALENEESLCGAVDTHVHLVIPDVVDFLILLSDAFWIGPV